MAEWAQLRAGPAIPKGLERGRWYQVEARHTDGTVDLLGPEAVPVPVRLVRLIDRDPDFITRVQGADFQVIHPGIRMQDLSYYGVCPREHFIGSLDPGTPEARCSQCDRGYRVEDEFVV